MAKDNNIELIISQGEFRRNQERSKKIKRKQYHKKIFKNALLFFKKLLPLFLVLLILAILIIININLKNIGVEGCLSNGYSYTYCIEHS